MDDKVSFTRTKQSASIGAPTSHPTISSQALYHYTPHYSKTCLKWSLKIDKTKILVTNGSLMKVKSIVECSKGCILQYFWPALSDNLSWKKTIFDLFESDRFRQVLLYVKFIKI